ncbi:toll/interleukin-1 receptor domain-containing protein [Rhizobium leguminosarum]|uniref:toll/interleukin-1 receptor domain-containing protein n=1 Tax=Rhizobium leguminosarum TaxID=384 RepID=UPI001C93A259|nr:toll/interleukin-1 receptor domain-containing protein [Rhizobium leguminosarum]MBY5523561.1 TIR domain-containing protein [Rhizobium leguminosarum]
MSDVYIVHASKDNEQTGIIVSLLSEHWDAWWDDNIVGDFAAAIEEQIQNTKCVILLWSANAKNSIYVKDELRLAQHYKNQIIPIRLDNTVLPYGLGHLSAVDLTAWNGEASHPNLQQLLRKITRVVPRRVPPVRPLAIASGRLNLPALFLSVSSHETQLVPKEAVRALRVFGAPSILVSAYDLLPSRRPKGIIQELKRIKRQGGLILIDSGNYEATRRDDDTWKPNLFAEAMDGVSHDWAYCFDVMRPSPDKDRAVRQVISAVERDSKAISSMILPIVHANRMHLGGYNTEDLPFVVREVARTLQPPLVAVAERELGRGMIERAKTVRRIRRELDKLPYYQPIHVLGTGNPWSIGVLTAAGADSFDGLEWCRMAVDRETHRLNHYQHFDFFAFQARLAESAVTVSAVSDDKVDYAGKVAFHNLDYFREFAAELMNSAHSKRLEPMLVGLMGSDSTKQLREHMPDLFT